MKKAAADSVRILVDFVSPDEGTPPLRAAFDTPVDVLVAEVQAEVPAVLDAVHAYARSGKWCVGFLSYEAAPAFDTALAVHAPMQGPLAWFGVFESEGAWREVEGEEPEVAWHLPLQEAHTRAAIAEIHRGIAAGDVYQINHTGRMRGELKRGTPEALFAALQRAQPNTYAAYIDTGTQQVLSVSPELFFDWREDGRILARPMKGTAPRGSTPSEDAENAAHLRTSQKERAENVMIVDLIRNDLSRIAELHSVKVARLFHTEALPTVWCMTTDVVARTRPATRLTDIFTALFPCGSVTGAPKVQAMRTIRGLEPDPRGVYCGAVGVVRPGGAATFNVPIRTVEVDHGKNVRCGIGSGITIDAGFEGEWREWGHKAAFVVGASTPPALLQTMRTENNVVANAAAHLRRLSGNGGSKPIHSVQGTADRRCQDAEQEGAALDAAHRLAQAFYRSRATRPLAATADFTALLDAFGGPTPEAGVSACEAIGELAAAAGPGLIGTVGSRFFGWVSGGSHPAGVAADWLTSVWGQNAACYEGAPAAAVAEQVVSQWLIDLLGLPSECSVGITTGATMSNFVCLAAARGALLRRVGWDVERDGMCGAPSIAVLVSDDAHASVFAALRYLGFGERTVVRIETDSAGRMRVAALRAALAHHRGPHLVIAQAGHIMTGAFDPIGEIAVLTREHGGWLHVDGAFGLWARACPTRAALAQGVEQADSWATDAHKWLQAPYECGCAFVRDAAAHRRAMSIDADYLPLANDIGARDPVHYAPELSRRARGFVLWTLLRTFGRSGIAQMIERHCALAQRLARRLSNEPGIAVLNEVELNQVLVRFSTHAPGRRGDVLTDATIERIGEAGVCFARGAQWRGRRVMRASVIAWPTTDTDIDCAADSMIAAWRDVRQQSPSSDRFR